MSKRFKSQDYFRYPRLGTKWRRPKGRQSKLRKGKGGSGMRVSIGYGTEKKQKNTIDGMKFSVVKSIRDLESAKEAIIISATLGAKKTKLIAEKAKQLNLVILNKKKVKKAERLEKKIAKRKQSKKEEKKKKAAEEKAKKEDAKKEKADKKMGFHESVVPQLMQGKTKTYRLRDHGLHTGDIITFENTQTGETIGTAKITHTERMPVGKIDIKDTAHFKVYDNTGELIQAFKRHYPEKNVTPETEAFSYTYEFTPTKAKGAKENNDGKTEGASP